MKEVNELNTYTSELQQLEADFFSNYHNILKEENRYGGTVVKNPKKLSKSKLKGIWTEFIRKQRHSYLKVNTVVTLDAIIRIGIDKFIITNGWTKVNHVYTWINNRVRMGICAHCQNQFIPLIFQLNFGLCNHCVPLFSEIAIQRYIEYIATQNKRYENAADDILMDFFIMFYHDENLRKQFLKTADFAKEMETKQFEPAEWLEKEKIIRAKQMGAIVDAEVVEMDE